MKKIWVTGASGMLGSTLVDLLGSEAIGTTRQEADVADREQMLSFARAIRPTHIINCAAYTDVDGAERESARAFAVNADGAANAAEAAKSVGAHLVHVSTDYVFPGSGTRPFVEGDLCAPPNSYGVSKWEGEKRVLEISPEACIVRTSWLFGKKGKNFISSILNWVQTKEQLKVVFDQCGSPTYCPDLAQAILSLLDAKGIVHFANTGALSRFQIALDILEAAKAQGIPVKCERVNPVPSAEFPTLAVRPSYSVLGTEKYYQMTNKRPRPWAEVVNEFIHANAL